jgi:hypothetical protein
MPTHPAEQQLRQHVLYMLKGGGAHIKFEEVVADFPAKLRGEKAPGLPHTGWQLLEHMRIAQWDIVEFSRSRRHKSPEFPEGYWPRTQAPADGEAWNNSIKSFKKDLKNMQEMVLDPKVDLFAKFPWGSGQTVLREALLLADHNSYHVGQMVLLRRALGTWE